MISGGFYFNSVGLVKEGETGHKERLLAQNLHEHPVELAANDASRLDRYSPEHRA